MSGGVFLDGRVELHAGSCLDVLPTLAENSFDSAVMDPPYHLTSIVKRFGADAAAPAKAGKTGAYARASSGFMGKKWDGGDVAFRPETWAEVLRVLKPGAYLIAFSGTRTYHRMVTAIEDAGFDIRDQIGWLYGAGFPKSHNVSKSLDGIRCSCERPQAPGVLLQHEVRSMRAADVSQAVASAGERDEVLLEGLPEQGLSGSVLRGQPEEGHADGAQPGMEGRGDLSEAARQLRVGEVRPMPAGTADDGEGGRLRHGASAADGSVDGAGTPPRRNGASSRPQPAQQRAGEPGAVADEPGPQAGGVWPLCGGCGKPIIPDGLGTALKPAWEPICLARKPLIGTNAENIAAFGTGGLNIDACRVGTESTIRPFGGQEGSRENGYGFKGNGREGEASAGRRYTEKGSTNFAARPGPRGGSESGRWPANLIHDGSDEVVAAFPESDGQQGDVRGTEPSSPMGGNTFGRMDLRVPAAARKDSGSAARFFYTAKADAEDRIGSKHPTVKPLDLMQYLVRLVTPKGGLVLDCFAGTGTTGEAAFREGMRAVLIEAEPEYQADIARRMELAQNPTKRAAVAKSKNNLQGAEGTPLFGDEVVV